MILSGNIIKVKLIPRASTNQISGREGDVYKVRITAAPVEGKANQALLELLSKRLGVPKSKIEIVSGGRSRLKSVRVDGLSPEAIHAALNNDSVPGQ